MFNLARPVFNYIDSLYDLKIRQMRARGLNGSREFHVPIWSMIFLALKFEFNPVVSFRNIILIFIESKSWTRVERGILVPKHAPFRNSSNLKVLTMSDFT